MYLAVRPIGLAESDDDDAAANAARVFFSSRLARYVRYFHRADVHYLDIRRDALK